MSHLATVSEAAKTLGLLDPSGKLVELDSLAVLDLVNELERITQISVPTSEMQAETFASIEAVSALLERLAAKE